MIDLIYFTSVTGHNIEFIHHLYMGHIHSNRNVVFVLPEKFNQQKNLFEWPECDRISFDLMPMDEVGSLGDAIYKKSIRFSRLLKKYIRKNQAKSVFVADIMGLMPFLPFILSDKVEIRGLTFGVYLYRWKTRAKYKSLIESMCHYLMVKSNMVKTVYVGNDTSAPVYYNKLFKTQKYKYVPDPFNIMDTPFQDMRQQYEISKTQKVFYHFGSMGGRKGTIQILKSILELSETEQKEYVFVFAGIVQQKEEFYQLINLIGNKVRVLVFDKFCDFQFIAQWCQCCDAILMPYLQTHSSSGILGYAAQYRKPVIGPNGGLIGKLIKRNHLGLTLQKITNDSLIQAYRDVGKWEYKKNNYLRFNSIEKFNEIVINK
jgi:hypothetical protein